MDRYGRYPRRILCCAGRLQTLRPRLLRFGRRSGRGERAPEEERSERERTRRASAVPRRRHYDGRQPAAGRRGGPLVRDFRQDRRDQFQGRVDRPQGRTAGQGQRQTAAGAAVALRSAAQAGRGPGLPPERTARKGRRQSGGLRAGQYGAGDAQRRYRHRQGQYRADGAACAVRRNYRSAKRQRGRLRLAQRGGGQADEDFAAQDRPLRAGALCQPDQAGNAAFVYGRRPERDLPGGGLRAGIEGGYRHAHAGRAGALSQYAGNAAAGTFRDR